MKKCHYFNPTCDMAVANNNRNYMAPEKLRLFENELCYIVSLLAQDNEFVAVESIPNQQYKEQIKNFTKKEINFIKKTELTDKSYSLQPWGWSPSLSKLSNTFEWLESYQELFSRKTGYQMLNNCHFNHSTIKNPTYEYVTTYEEILDLLEKWKKIVIKSLWSSSGRGIVIYNNPDDKTGTQWIKGFLQSQKGAFVEPFYKKTQDFSLLFEKKQKGVEFIGTTYFFTTDEKNYGGHYIGNTENLKKNNYISDCLSTEEETILTETFLKALNSIDLATYQGYLGIDAMIVDQNGTRLILPFCELNLRTTMGIIALQISKQIHTKSYGKMQISSAEDTFTSHKFKQNSKKACWENGQFTKGYFTLLPITEQSKTNAWLEIDC
ncbi:MAG: hypothetical protein IPO21_09605 [Bacteroidales bacterium]|nr:hypothetical protein [Bacteroidales bacterium]